MLLQGTRVVELATWVAGPGCAAIMADWGATVVKVESPVGDPTRIAALPDAADGTHDHPVFTMENRGKRSVVLDLSKQDDRARLSALLRDADVFVTNLRPGQLARFRLDYDTLHRELPRLIYASITGYGLVGAARDLPAFDLTAFWTRSGIAASTIPPDQEPFSCRPGFGDHATALATLSGVLAALYEREKTGVGRLVEASLLRTAAYAIGWDLSIQLKFGQAVTAQPRADRPSAISGFFRTADDRWLCIVPRGDACFYAVMRMIGRAEILDDPAFALPITDLDVVRAIRAWVDESIGKMTLAQATARLTADDVIWAPMATLQEFTADPQSTSAGCFVEIREGQSGPFLSPAAPIRFPEGAPPVERSAPRLGQHNHEVFGAANEIRWGDLK
jgi:crotonobetainyl-CoA:carnitine CoA-transferase CaiB-like acyl-CoA transferase